MPWTDVVKGTSHLYQEAGLEFFLFFLIWTDLFASHIIFHTYLLSNHKHTET